MGKRIDLSGQIINRWRVIRYAHSQKFECECLGCGDHHLVESYKLRNNTSRQCTKCALENRRKNGIKCSGNNIQINCIKDIKKLLNNFNIKYTEIEANDKMSYDFKLLDFNIIISFIYTADYINDKKRNQNLTMSYRKKGIRLINIFEYEWRDDNRRNKIKNLIIRDTVKANIRRIYARNTKIITLDNSGTKRFLEENHIQGYVSAAINLGLTYKNELVAIMNFGKPRFGDDDGYELLRLAFKSDVEILGGSEKLFKYFVDTYHPYSIISFCAITRFSGRVYKKLGFNAYLPELTSPNYQWVEPITGEYLARYRCMKQKLIDKGWGDYSDTEDSIMRRHGYLKVFDSGNEKYTWIRQAKVINKIEEDAEYDF